MNKPNRWTPSDESVKSSQMLTFKKHIEGKYDVTLPEYNDLWLWSVDNIGDFWSEVWDFCGIKASKKGEANFIAGDSIEDAEFFPEARLNFAENLLRSRDDDRTAIIFRGEDRVKRELSFKELYDEVSKTAEALKDIGVIEGDRVAGYLPNMPEAIIAMLATASLGGIWVAASPDFGVQGVLDRLGQVEPKVLFSVNAYAYNGKDIDCRCKLHDILEQLPSVENTVICDYISDDTGDTALKGEINYKDFTNGYEAQDIDFAQLPFNHPLYIMFSSGTTGVPKCIVHGAGGTLLQHVKEHRLHSDIKEDDKEFYFTTCGWMMWQWLVSGLACDATLMLYDGSPFYPDGYALFDFAEEHKCNFFGTSAKFVDSLKKAGLSPKDKHDLSSIKMLASTGSPLVHESFDYIYEHIGENIHISSISGGTDIVSCFVLGNPISSVYRGEIQGAGLGMNVDVFDENGQSITNMAGDLVCKSPFPSMPIKFWNDGDGQKYHDAYFNSFDNIWCHGDWCAFTENENTDSKGMIIYGRSDATLNPGGVRIGTAEIYRQVEKLPEIKESIAVGQDIEDGDMRVVLFVILTADVDLNEELEKKIKQTIRSGASPRHVPAKIVTVTDIPRTKSGKITELAVRNVIHGRKIKNAEALANPEALEQFKNRSELALPQNNNIASPTKNKMP